MRRGIFFMFLLVLAFKAEASLAYDNDFAHPKLTKAIIDYWNKSSEKKISQEEENWIIKGSIDEDNPSVRCLNHFYDPINIKGLTIVNNKLNFGIPAPLWASSPYLQQLDFISGNYSWPSALYNYKEKNYKKSFLALGHNLHLLEDMSVPAHTRDDQHLEGDPYENWVKENIKKLSIKEGSINKANCKSMIDCFTVLATITNSSFLSKDSINANKFKLPFEKININSDGYAIFEGEKVAFYNVDKQAFELNSAIHETYWNNLSPLVVSFGARLLDLFFNGEQKNINEAKVENAKEIADVSDSFLESNNYINSNQELKKVYEEAKKIVKENEQQKEAVPIKFDETKIEKELLDNEDEKIKAVENYIPEEVDLEEEKQIINNNLDSLDKNAGQLINNIQKAYTELKEGFINNVSASTIDISVENNTTTPTTTLELQDENNSTTTPTSTSAEDEDGEDEQPLYLWHFNDCKGGLANDSISNEKIYLNIDSLNKWVIGKFNCAFEQNWRDGHNVVIKNFEIPEKLNETTLSYYYKDINDSSTFSRTHFYLKGNEKVSGISISHYDWAKIIYNNNEIDFGKNLIPLDKEWHNISIVFSEENLAFYFDGELVKEEIGDFSLDHELASLEIGQENAPTDLDELAIWDKALSSEEIKNIFESHDEIAPKDIFREQLVPKKVYNWNFNETSGQAIDSINNLALKNVFYSNGIIDGGIYMDWRPQYKIVEDLNKDIKSSDVSIGVFVKNISFPNEGRGSIILANKDELSIFGLRHSSNYSRTGIYFNGEIKNVGDIIPDDESWHYLTIIYDSYKYSLSFYVDGVLKYSEKNIWLDGDIEKIIIQGENFPYEIDELSIWQGALNNEDIKNIYSNYISVIK